LKLPNWRLPEEKKLEEWCYPTTLKLVLYLRKNMLLALGAVHLRRSSALGLLILCCQVDDYLLWESAMLIGFE
jgi:hypothetical protein